MKTLLKTWSELYRAFARCAALVATAEENLCCEELSSKILCSVEDEVLSVSFPCNIYVVNWREHEKKKFTKASVLEVQLM